MVMAPHHLARFAHHRPAALQVQGDPGGVEAHRLQVGAGLLQHQADQGREGRLAVQPPGAVQIAGPGATRIGIRNGEALQLPDRLELQGHIEGVDRQLHHPQGEGKERLQGEGARGPAHIAEAPPTTSRISWVMAAWRALL
jgi:hypothetical protein